MANSAFSSGNLSNITIPETLPIGSIIPYPGATAPTNWLLCYGQVLSRTTYPNLYTAVGDYAVADAQLTTRTDNDTGVITIVGGNRGLTTSETLNVYWSGGSRTGMTITNVTGATVTVDGGSGDNLPNNLTLVWCSIAASKFFNYDFRGRSPIGIDSMGGTSANRVAAAWADTMGQYGGEENHTLTVTEMPSHTHPQSLNCSAQGTLPRYDANQYTGGSGCFAVEDSLTANRNPSYPVNTQSVGGGGSHNNMQPGIATNWIIKYAQSTIAAATISTSTPAANSGSGSAGTTGQVSDAGHVHPAIAHNDTTGLQGGTTNEYYHLTEEQYNALGGGGIVTTTTFDIAAGATIAAGRGVFLDSAGKACQGLFGATAVSQTAFQTVVPTALLPQIVTLDSTHIIVAYYSTNNMCVRCGSISGTTITWGAEAQIHAVGESWFTLIMLDSTHFVVGYAKGANYFYARCGSISGTTITLGAEATVKAATVSSANSSMAMLDSTHFACGYLLGSNSYGVICSVSTVTITVGTAVYTSASNKDCVFSILVMDSTHILLASSCNGVARYVACGSISDTTITWGAEVYFGTSANLTKPVSLKLDSTHFVLAYRIATPKAVVIAGSISDTTITMGSEIYHATYTDNGATLVYRDSTHFIWGFNAQNIGTANTIAIALCSCSGTGNRTVTIDSTTAGPYNGTSYDSSYIDPANWGICMGEDANTFMFTYYTTTAMKIQVGTINGSTVTWAPCIIFSALTGSAGNICRITTNLYASIWATTTTASGGVCWLHQLNTTGGLSLAGIAKTADNSSTVDVYQIHTYLAGYTGLTDGALYYLAPDGLPTNNANLAWYYPRGISNALTLGRSTGTTAILVNTNKTESTKLY